jgi:hypothetical protein
MQKWGQSKNGKTRYRCPKCNISLHWERPDVKKRKKKQKTLEIFFSWILGNENLSNVAKKHGVTRMTLSRWFFNLKFHPSRKRRINTRGKVIIIDGVYLGKSQGRKIVALIVRTTTQVVTWKFCARECFETWREILCTLDHPKAIVCDGQKGMVKAVSSLWSGVIIQRCRFHIQSFCLARVPKKPKYEAEVLLRRLIVRLGRIKTLEQKDQWLSDLHIFCQAHYDYLFERVFYRHYKTGKLVSMFAHKKARAAIAHLNNSFPYLWHYLDHPDIPPTSNHVEGGVNSRLKELTRRHRGVTLKKKIILTHEYLHLRQKSLQKPTRNVT